MTSLSPHVRALLGLLGCQLSWKPISSHGNVCRTSGANYKVMKVGATRTETGVYCRLFSPSNSWFRWNSIKVVVFVSFYFFSNVLYKMERQLNDWRRLKPRIESKKFLGMAEVQRATSTTPLLILVSPFFEHPKWWFSLLSSLSPWDVVILFLERHYEFWRRVTSLADPRLSGWSALSEF